MPTRTHGFDNLKLLLIFCVVLGHVLECCPGWNGLNAGLYRLIYAFHMPAFLFLSGWFARFRPRDLVFRLIYLYLLFQLLYQLFNRFLLNASSQPLQLTTPHWLLWYLLVLILFHLLLPMLKLKGKRRQWVVVLCCVAAAVVAGFDGSIGYYLSLGRLFSFLPFFVLGHFAGEHYHQRVAPMTPRRAILSTLAAVVAGVGTWLFDDLPRKVLWGANGYEESGGEWWTELILLAVALAWIAFLLGVVLPLLDRPIPLLTPLGRGTLPIFLLHGLVIEYIKYRQLLSGATLLHALGLSLALVVVLGNPFMQRVFAKVCTGWWLEKLWNKL